MSTQQPAPNIRTSPLGSLGPSAPLISQIESRNSTAGDFEKIARVLDTREFSEVAMNFISATGRTDKENEMNITITLNPRRRQNRQPAGRVDETGGQTQLGGCGRHFPRLGNTELSYEFSVHLIDYHPRHLSEGD